MTILLTGGAGFIGSFVGEGLLARGHRVVAVDDFNDFYDPAIKRANVATCLASDRFELREGDIRDGRFLDEVFASHRFDAVVHLAAWAGVRPSIERPELYVEVNVGGTTSLLERARAARVQRFVFASSSSVYGGRDDPPFRETDPVDRPVSPYAATKRAGELLCATYHKLYGMSATCLRYFTVYGPRQRPEMAIHKFARLLAAGQPVPVHGDGSSSRDYTYIDDIVDGTLRALERCEGFEIYNLGESETTTLEDLVSMLGEAMGVEPRILRLPDQAGDVPMTWAEITKAQERIGYAPSVPVREGVRRFAEWFRSRPGAGLPGDGE
jgi:UDP-glucuronate 4-epimerase